MIGTRIEETEATLRLDPRSRLLKTITFLADLLELVIQGKFHFSTCETDPRSRRTDDRRLRQDIGGDGHGEEGSINQTRSVDERKNLHPSETLEDRSSSSSSSVSPVPTNPDLSQGLILVFDDARTFDDRSALLLEEVMSRKTIADNLLLVMATRQIFAVEDEPPLRDGDGMNLPSTPSINRKGTQNGPIDIGNGASFPRIFRILNRRTNPWNFKIRSMDTLGPEDCLRLIFEDVSYRPLSPYLGPIIVCNTGGNPFFIRELLRSYVEVRTLLKYILLFFDSQAKNRQFFFSLSMLVLFSFLFSLYSYCHLLSRRSHSDLVFVLSLSLAFFSFLFFSSLLFSFLFFSFLFCFPFLLQSTMMILPTLIFIVLYNLFPNSLTQENRFVKVEGEYVLNLVHDSVPFPIESKISAMIGNLSATQQLIVQVRGEELYMSTDPCFSSATYSFFALSISPFPSRFSHIYIYIYASIYL